MEMDAPSSCTRVAMAASVYSTLHRSALSLWVGREVAAIVAVVWAGKTVRGVIFSCVPLSSLCVSCQRRKLPRVWKAAAPPPSDLGLPRLQQDWILKCLQGGRAIPLARLWGGDALRLCGATLAR